GRSGQELGQLRGVAAQRQHHLVPLVAVRGDRRQQPAGGAAPQPLEGGGGGGGGDQLAVVEQRAGAHPHARLAAIGGQRVQPDRQVRRHPAALVDAVERVEQERDHLHLGVAARGDRVERDRLAEQRADQRAAVARPGLGAHGGGESERRRHKADPRRDVRAPPHALRVQKLTLVDPANRTATTRSRSRSPSTSAAATPATPAWKSRANALTTEPPFSDQTVTRSRSPGAPPRVVTTSGWPSLSMSASSKATPTPW